MQGMPLEVSSGSLGVLSSFTGLFCMAYHSLPAKISR